jgi:diacylglycerol kinase family enzyme
VTERCTRLHWLLPVLNRTLGLLPVVSGDNFAFALGINRSNLFKEVDVVRRGSVRILEFGFVNDVPFVNAVGVGFDADVTHRMRISPGFLKGRPAYLYAVMSTLLLHRLVPVEVAIDGN